MSSFPWALGFAGVLFVACNATPELAAESTSPTDFRISFQNADTLRAWLADSTLYGSGCQLQATEIDGSTALQLTTDREFSDGFIDLEKLFGRPVDLKNGGFLSAEIYVPQESWIATLKFNARDAAGNFGGFQEVMNHFPSRYDQWLHYTVPVAELLPDWQNWSGDSDPLEAVQQLSLNPYNAHQRDPSHIYVRSLQLSDAPPAAAATAALLPRTYDAPNQTYHIDFDDEEWLREQIAYRSFESSSQAFATGIGGNATRAIRLRGEDHLRHIAWLPILPKVTGAPVDFSQVDSIYFSYYLTPDGDDFNGTHLFLTGEHWNDVLLDTTFHQDFTRGVWTRLAVAVDDLDLNRVRGDAAAVSDEELLTEIHELRFDIKYFPERKNIEMWIDDFGWK